MTAADGAKFSIRGLSFLEFDLELTAGTQPPGYFPFSTDSVAAAGLTSLAGFCSGSRVAEAGFTSGSFSAAVF